MEKYINQLIDDFKFAEANPAEELDFGDTYEEFEKQMLEIENARYEPSKQVLGVSYEELPPAEKMNIGQIQRLLDAIINALSAKGTNVSFPGDDIPVKLAYEQLREHFKDGFYSVPGWTIDFCDGNCPDCAFAEYCSAKPDVWDE